MGSFSGDSGCAESAQTDPVNPHPLNLGGADSPLNLGGEKPLLLQCFSRAAPCSSVNLRCESSPPEFRGYGLTSADGATGPGIAKQLKRLKSDSKMTFQGPGESDSKMTRNLTLSQRRVISGVFFESLLPDPEKSFLSHRKCHFWVRDLWPNGVSQGNLHAIVHKRYMHERSLLKFFSIVGTYRNLVETLSHGSYMLLWCPVTCSMHTHKTWEAIVWIGKRCSLDKGSCQKSPSSRDSRDFRDARDSREPQSVENKGTSDHFLVEVLENVRFRFWRFLPVNGPLS